MNMEKIVDIQSEEALKNYLRQFTNNENEVLEAAEKFWAAPSGTIIPFVCRQDIDDQGRWHKQKAIRICHI